MVSLHQLASQGNVTGGRKQATSFSKVKELLQTPRVLVHYDSSKPLLLAVDASSYGIRAVLFHKLPDGSDRPIGFASRSVTDAKWKYSQLEKESLAIEFGLKHLHFLWSLLIHSQRP